MLNSISLNNFDALESPVKYKKISDYGIIGNFHTVALIALDGSIDWLCLPHIDSPSVFAAILDAEKGGCFAVRPLEPFDSTAAYLPGTNILTTTFRTRTGTLRLTDFMPVSENVERDYEREVHDVYRKVEVVDGEVDVRVSFSPRFDYARAATTLELRGEAVIATGGGEGVILGSSRPGLQVRDATAEATWRLARGESLWLELSYDLDGARAVDPERLEALLMETGGYWRSWLANIETGEEQEYGPFNKMIERSALVLKLLEFGPTGAIAAAATTSLPEVIGGVRNWDYRFTWVRDASLTIESLFGLGHLSEMEDYLRWMKDNIIESGRELQIMYSLHGETELTEYELPHLEGYKGSSPVRVGNGAYDQKQLDIYGELMDAALRLSNYVGKVDEGMWVFLRHVCDRVVTEWREKDSGIWEVRGGPYHFVYSKVMCWVALDRGVTIAKRYGFPGDIENWERIKAEIKQEVLKKGWSEKKKAFKQHYDSDALDASNLMIPIFRFISFDDPMMVSTVEAIRRELVTEGGFVYRYRSEDHLPGHEGVFLFCSFLYIANLIHQGKLDEAHTLLLRMEKTANHLGLFSEEYDVTWNEALGNFPQALTHIGYIYAVRLLYKARRGHERTIKARKVLEKHGVSRPFPRKIILNDGTPPEDVSTEDIANDLKRVMNVLRGAFFSIYDGRVAYEEMAASPGYEEFKELSYSLKRFDLGRLRTQAEKLAFWIDLYNVLVLDGVVTLGIRESVQEIRGFFRRICYQVGDLRFSPDDIEHGILRRNHRLPNSLFRPFGRRDPRCRHIIDLLEPRMHFALVCASKACPPIDVYTAEGIDEELDISVRTVVNAGGVEVDRERGIVRISQIFKWYADDFGSSKAERLRFIAPFIYREQDRTYLSDNAERVRVRYLPYDWRLNR